MITRRTFASAATLFAQLTARGTDPNDTGVGSAENPGPGLRRPQGPGLGIARLTAATPNGALLDRTPFLMAAGELHPGRTPHPYWNQRIRMVKSKGFSTLSNCHFWSRHESNFDPATGPQFDFATAGNHLPLYIDLCTQHTMWMFLRPGPFVDAFRDLGGIALAAKASKTQQSGLVVSDGRSGLANSNQSWTIELA